MAKESIKQMLYDIGISKDNEWDEKRLRRLVLAHMDSVSGSREATIKLSSNEQILHLKGFLSSPAGRKIFSSDADECVSGEDCRTDVMEKLSRILARWVDNLQVKDASLESARRLNCTQSSATKGKAPLRSRQRKRMSTIESEAIQEVSDTGDISPGVHRSTSMEYQPKSMMATPNSILMAGISDYTARVGGSSGTKRGFAGTIDIDEHASDQTDDESEELQHNTLPPSNSQTSKKPRLNNRISATSTSHPDRAKHAAPRDDYHSVAIDNTPTTTSTQHRTPGTSMRHHVGGDPTLRSTTPSATVYNSSSSKDSFWPKLIISKLRDSQTAVARHFQTLHANDDIDPEKTHMVEVFVGILQTLSSDVEAIASLT